MPRRARLPTRVALAAASPLITQDLRTPPRDQERAIEVRQCGSHRPSARARPALPLVGNRRSDPRAHHLESPRPRGPEQLCEKPRDRCPSADGKRPKARHADAVPQLRASGVHAEQRAEDILDVECRCELRRRAPRGFGDQVERSTQVDPPSVGTIRRSEAEHEVQEPERLTRRVDADPEYVDRAVRVHAACQTRAASMRSVRCIER